MFKHWNDWGTEKYSVDDIPIEARDRVSVRWGDGTVGECSVCEVVRTEAYLGHGSCTHYSNLVAVIKHHGVSAKLRLEDLDVIGVHKNAGADDGPLPAGASAATDTTIGDRAMGDLL